MVGTDRESRDRKEGATIGHAFAHFPLQVVFCWGSENVARYMRTPDLGVQKGTKYGLIFI